MSVNVQVSEVINRSVEDVFRFYALEHVQNHPRWDPNMELEQLSDGPIGVGTIINRVNSRSGTPVEGTMEVVEFELNQTLGMVIHDGPVEMNGRATFEAEGDDRTTLRLNIELPNMDEAMDTSLLNSQIQQSLRNIKQLIESEV
jgi:uncharacterized membrane protein